MYDGTSRISIYIGRGIYVVNGKYFPKCVPLATVVTVQWQLGLHSYKKEKLTV